MSTPLGKSASLLSKPRMKSSVSDGPLFSFQLAAIMGFLMSRTALNAEGTKGKRIIGGSASGRFTLPEVESAVISI